MVNIIKPHQKFQLKCLETNVPAIISEITEIVKSCLPLVQNIEVWNRTKKCVVTVSANEGKLTVVISNPDDEIFRCDEEPDATTEEGRTDRGTRDNGR